MKTIHIRPRYVRCLCGCNHFLKIGDGRTICQQCESDSPSHYYLEFFFAGRQYTIYSDEKGRSIDTLVRAKLLREDVLYELRNGSFSIKKYSKAKMLRVGVLLDQFLKEKLKELAPSYKQNYVSQHKVAKRFFGAKNIREITKPDLIAYQSHIQTIKPTIGPSTVKNYLSWFVVFLNWCKERELITVVPSLPKIECPEPPVRWLSREDQMKLLDVARPQDKDIIKFAMLQGTRPGETRALKVKDVDLNNQVIHITSTFSNNVYTPRRKGRGAPPSTIPIHPEVMPYIEERCKSNLPEAWLFPNPKGKFYSIQRWAKAWKHIRTTLGITDINSYQATRHSFASQLGSSGVPVQTIKNLLGHTDIAMTMKYTHPEIESMRKAMTNVGFDNRVVDISSKVQIKK